MRAEVRLRVPNMKDRVKNAAGYPIDHGEMRFRKIIEIPGIPHEGDRLELTTRSGTVLHASVVHAGLDEPRQLFVLACQYAQRTMTRADYDALANDPDWELKHLLEP